MTDEGMDKLSLIDIIETYFYKDELQRLLEKAELKKSGTKRELEKRLIF